MARVTVEDCLENVENRFALVMLATKRSRQLATGGKEPKVPVENDKPTVLPELGENAIWAVFNSTMPLETAFYNGIAFIIIFFVTKIILQIIASMLDFLARLPVLHSINKLLGSILGFLEVYLIMFILLYMIALVPIQSIQTRVEGSFVAKLIVEHTPFLSSGIESLWFTDLLSKIV